MVLRKSVYGLQAAGFGKAGPSGVLSNERRAESDLDPLITPSYLTRAGRLSGYALQFGPGRSRISNALQQRNGLLEIGSLVELYRDEPSVSRELKKSVRDLRSLVGKPLNLGGTLERVRVTRVSGIGDEALRLTLVVRVSGVRIHITEVGFRSGRLAGIVAETRADATNVDAELTSLARALDRRIGQVLG